MAERPDALGLDRIGRALADEFTDKLRPDESCGECGFGNRLPAFVTYADFIHPQPGRTDAERLVRVLDELGFEIVRSGGGGRDV